MQQCEPPHVFVLELDRWCGDSGCCRAFSLSHSLSLAFLCFPLCPTHIINRHMFHKQRNAVRRALFSFSPPLMIMMLQPLSVFFSYIPLITIERKKEHEIATSGILGSRAAGSVCVVPDPDRFPFEGFQYGKYCQRTHTPDRPYHKNIFYSLQFL